MNKNNKHLISLLSAICILFIHNSALSTPQIHTVTPSSATIAKYEKLELSVTLSATYSNPYDFSDVNLKGIFISPTGQQFIMDGFYFQDYEMTSPNVLVVSGSPGWRVRFSPNETGLWTYTVTVSDGTGNASSTPGEFTCTSSGRKGFVNRDGSKLVYSNGETFHGLGTNLAFQWWSQGFTAYEEWIDALSENGGNFTKLSMAPWIFEIEWDETGLGQYTERQDRAWVLDWVFDMLMQKNIYCQLNVLIHSDLRTDFYMGWNKNPYSDQNGGPCNAPQNFYENETAIIIYKQKLRYINARWGYSPQLALWEHISEADNTQLYEDYYNQTFSWLTLMSSYVDYIDVYNRPVSTGYAIPQHDPNFWEHYSTGFTQLHLYDFIPDLEMKIYNFSKWNMDTWNKPFIVGEFALGHDVNEILLNDPNGIAFHNTLWSSMFSGSSTSAMSWWWDNYLFPNGLFEYFEPVSSFFQELESDISSLQPVVPLCTSDVYDMISVEPDFNNQNTQTPEAFFNYHSSGLLYPIELFLGRYLYGSLYGNRRNPPTFYVNYSTEGMFTVRTGGLAILSKVKVQLDNVTIINLNASSNSTYSIEVPAGQHSIRIENSSLGMLEINKYEFYEYAPELRAFALKNDNTAAGWIQNRKYNWQYVQQNGTPNPVTNGKIFLENMTPGLYEVEWFNSNGIVDSIQSVFHVATDMILNSPNIIWDAAFQVNYISPVIVSFDGIPTEGFIPLSVQFTDQTISSGVAIDAWNWDFGDGNTSSNQNPEHTYINPGSYTVILEVVTGNYTSSFVRENYITAIQPLVAEFIADTTVSLPDHPIQFTDLSLGSPDVRMWSFGDNNLSFDTNPTHAYQNPGQYTVSLSIQKGTETDIEIKTNYINIISPLVADFTSDIKFANTVQEIQFYDLSTGNPDIWFWDFGNGITSNEANPIIIYDQPGAYSVKLIVNTNYLEDSIIKQNYIHVFEPLIVEFAADETSVWPGQEVHFLDQSTGNPIYYYWHFGDGNTSILRYPNHSYAQPGYYSVTLEVNNFFQNDSVTKENFILVKQPLVADFIADRFVVPINDEVIFTDLSLGNPSIWLWDFGDQTNSPFQNPNHVYDTPGEYTVALQIFKNDSSDFEIKENYIEVIPLLIADFSTDKQIALPGEVIQFFDETTGNPTTWLWDFGAFNNQNIPNPEISYQNPGIYTVSLTVWNEYLTDTIVKENYITILEPLVADFTVVPFEGKIGENIAFYDLSIGNPNSWEWWPGNGDTSFVQNPITVYNTSGLYNVTLIVENEYQTDTLSRENFLFIIPPYYSQNIFLKAGWSGISTYVRPALPAIGEVFEPVSDAFFFAVNDQGVFSPDLNINTIGNWDTQKGLTVFMYEQAQITIEGYALTNNDLMLEQGWSFLPVFCQCSHPVNLMSEIMGDDLKIIKEIGSWNIFWPDMGISTLDSIRPGYMYQIYMNQPYHFTFPECN